MTTLDDTLDDTPLRHTAPVIEAKGLSKTYSIYRGHGRGWLAEKLLPWQPRERFVESLTGLSDVDLAVAPGEIVGVIGRNGSGKSTLLRLIGGITEPTTGAVHVAGDLRCVLASGTAFDARLTGRENILYGSIVMGVPRRVARERTPEIVAFAGLEASIDLPTMYYSRGMRSRLALSVALQDAPEILILDEALSAGDAGFIDRCRSRIEDLCVGGRTALIATHSMTFVRSMCTRAILLADGQIVADGEPREVIENYLAGFRSDEAADDSDRGEPRKPRADGAVEMVDAFMCGPDGVRRDRFSRGEPLELRVALSTRRRVLRPRFAIELLSAPTGTRVSQLGTYYLDAQSKELSVFHVPALDGEHELVIRIPESPLGAGEFYWRVSVFTRASADQPAVTHLDAEELWPFTSVAFPDHPLVRQTIVELESELSLTTPDDPVRCDEVRSPRWSAAPER